MRKILTIMKKKLLLVTGAGASIDFGFPSVKCIDKILEDKAEEYVNMPFYKLNSNPYTYLKEQAGRKFDGSEFTYEELLYLMELIESSQMPCLSAPTSKLFPLAPEFCRLYAKCYSGLRAELIDELLEKIRNHAKTWKNNQDIVTNFNKFKHFLLHEIGKDYDISFVTTNYDNILTEIFPDPNTGFDENGVFQRAQLYNDLRWNKGIYLHGSVHFDMEKRPSGGLHKIYWKDNLNSRFEHNAFGRSGMYTTEGNQILSSVIIAGLDKTNQILKEPFLQYYMMLDRLAFEADAILFIGYGFNDWHLNSVFSFLGEGGKNTKKIVIIDYKNEYDEEDPMELSYTEGWHNRVCRTLPFDYRKLENKRYTSPTTPKDLKEWKELEYSNDDNYPIAFWYDGLISACDHADKIMDRL